MVVSPSLPALIARLYSLVAVLQLQGVLLPPACTGAAPFETEYSTMGAALGLWLAAVCIYYALHNPYGRLGGQFVLMWAMPRWTTRRGRLGSRVFYVGVCATTSVHRSCCSCS